MYLSAASQKWVRVVAFDWIRDNREIFSNIPNYNRITESQPNYNRIICIVLVSSAQWPSAKSHRSTEFHHFHPLSFVCFINWVSFDQFHRLSFTSRPVCATNRISLTNIVEVLELARIVLLFWLPVAVCGVALSLSLLNYTTRMQLFQASDDCCEEATYQFKFW